MKSIDIINTDRSRKATVMMLAWPILVEQMLASLVQAADSAMVGSLGAAATASVAINSAPNMLINQIFFALGLGFTSLIARSVGAGDRDRARHLTEQAVTLVFIVGIALSFVTFSLARAIPSWMGGEEIILHDAETYNRILSLSLLFRAYTMVLTAIYRGYGDTHSPMVVNVLVNVLNVIGNYFMIYPTREVMFFGHSFEMFGFGWGVAGAAVATTLSGVIGGMSLLFLSFRKNAIIRIGFDSGLVPDRREMSAVFRIATPAILERCIMSSAFIVVGRAIASLGTVAVAANNLAGTAESLSYMPGFAFGAAATTLFGQSIGSGNEELGKQYVKETLQLGTIVMAVMTVLMFTFSNQIMGIFTPDQEVIEIGSVLLKILAVIQIPQMMSSVYSGAVKGAGDSTTPFLIALASMWGVRLLGVVFCVHVLGMGLYAVCVCTCVDNVVRFSLFHHTYHKGTWRKRMKSI